MLRVAQNLTFALFLFSFYETKVVFLAIGITAVVCICVTVFCFQTKVGCVSSGCCAFVPSCLLNKVLLLEGGLHQVPGSFLRAGDRGFCDRPHFRHRLVL